MPTTAVRKIQSTLSSCKRKLYHSGLKYLTAPNLAKQIMSFVEENWQTARPTIRERAKFMLNNDLFSDVKFVVRKSDGESESKQVIPAHKFVLSIGSPVFEAMFYGELVETRDSIELPDCEYESLLELFRYMYSDEVNLSGSNVMGVLYLAKKYMVPSLTVKCTEYLQDNLDPSNVFSILPSAQKYEEEKLVNRCWKVIDEQTEAAMKSDGFATVERSLLEAMVERDALNIAEVELFKGVTKWATKELEKRGTRADGQEKRRILGERIVKAIRFPVMKQEEFASVVLDSKILTLDEVTDIIKCFNSVQSCRVGFSVTKRCGPSSNVVRCSRFGSVKYGWNNGKSAICFTVDRDILFHGACLFGSKDHSYSVILTLKRVDGSGIFFSLIDSTKATFFPSVPSTSGEYFRFDVLFEKPVLITEGVKCLLLADISGPTSWYGINGESTLRRSGVTFALRDISSSADGTDTRKGQFNELIFSLNK